MLNDVFLSVVIPSYNEMKNIGRAVLDEVYTYLSTQTYSWEVVLSDDGSQDGTVEELRKFVSSHEHTVLIENEHGGKASTVRAGMLRAKGNVRLFTDFDQATPISEIEKLFPFTQKGYDVVIGSREVDGSRRDKEHFYRHIMGKGFNLFVQLFAFQGIHDTQCGFKLFSARATEVLFPKMIVYGSKQKTHSPFTGAFDVELLYIAKILGFEIAEVPVHWKHVTSDRVNPIKDSAIMFIDLIRIRVTDLLGKYEKKS